MGDTFGKCLFCRSSFFFDSLNEIVFAGAREKGFCFVRLRVVPKGQRTLSVTSRVPLSRGSEPDYSFSIDPDPLMD
jgi:hypothetical protein